MDYKPDTKENKNKSKAIYFGNTHFENPDMSLKNFESHLYTKESRILVADESEFINLESDFDKFSVNLDVRIPLENPNDEIHSNDKNNHSSFDDSSIFSNLSCFNHSK